MYTCYNILCRTPKGLEDVSKYPYLFAELIRRGYTDDEIKKIARKNLIRVLQDVERYYIAPLIKHAYNYNLSFQAYTCMHANVRTLCTHSYQY